MQKAKEKRKKEKGKRKKKQGYQSFPPKRINNPSIIQSFSPSILQSLCSILRL
jgi:hypothetical protein